MTGWVPTTLQGRRGWDQLLAEPAAALLAFDFDGTLSPIVDNPEQAYVHPAAVAVLARLGPAVGTVAVITGRPVETVLRLAPVAGVPGLQTLVVLGQYGVERWDAITGEVESPPAPPGVAQVRAAFPDLLARLGLGGARIEDKGRAVAVHVRELPDPEESLARLQEPVSRLAATHGLSVEPGRLVLELRAPGMDKGRALRALVRERGARCVVYAGDDLGDLAAYDEVDAMRDSGLAGILVCSASAEQGAVAERADVVVTGPDGLVGWLERLADRLGV
ncbi:MAG: trehalose-phosphatase [Nocardioidaceae bacterium]